jgi:antitoxin CptB
MDYIKKQKMRWRSRRSMLELDLYFDRFITSGKFDKLSDEELDSYNELLQMDDNDILFLFQGTVRLSDMKIQNIIDQIRII